MLTTSRISSDFDVELQLGAGWFKVAVGTLADAGVLALPNGAPAIVGDVVILPSDPDWDLQLTFIGVPIPVRLKVTLSPDGRELTLTADLAIVPPQTIPFGALTGLSGAPVLTKVAGDNDRADAIVILANLAIHAEPQDADRLPSGETVPRGDVTLVQSFLPSGSDIAFGMGKASYQRFANNLWHTNLRASDGTHPLPGEEDPKGKWNVVSMTGRSGALRVTLKGEVPIDLFPDADVTITLILTPSIVDGNLTFRIETDEDIDTGLLGDLLAALAGGFAGGLIGLVIGIFTGGILVGLLIGFGVGALVGVIALEIAEVVVEGIVRKEIRARIGGETLPSVTVRRENLVQIAMPTAEEGQLSLSVLDAIPSSISVHNENPADEILFRRNLLVTSLWDDFSVTRNGFAVAGVAGTDERFEPERVSIARVSYADDVLESVTYRRNDGREQTLTVAEIRARTAAGELRAPFRLAASPTDATFRIPEGKIACVCLDPVRIQREDTIVAEIEFSNGVRLLTPDAIALQDTAAIVVVGFQLIHPRDYNAYYRAKADFFLENNFERLPEYQP